MKSEWIIPCCSLEIFSYFGFWVGNGQGAISKVNFTNIFSFKSQSTSSWKAKTRPPILTERINIVYSYPGIREPNQTKPYLQGIAEAATEETAPLGAGRTKGRRWERRSPAELRLCPLRRGQGWPGAGVSQPGGKHSCQGGTQTSKDGVLVFLRGP